MNILAVANYPDRRRPERGAFVHATLRALARRGHQVTVVAPCALFRDRRIAAAYERDGVRVRAPLALTFSNRRIGPLHTFPWSLRGLAAAARRGALGVAADIVYGHFLYPGGYLALGLARRLGVPAVCGLGEDTLDAYAGCGADVDGLLRRLDGIVAVSAANRERALAAGAAPERVWLVRNGVDLEAFHPIPKDEARRALGLPPKGPIAAFVGALDERKGPLRLLAALEGLSGPPVGALFVGEGPQRPAGPRVLFQGRVPHADLPRYLNAADLFVLPTLSEGMPNAVLEAMACGLPVVTSDLPFNREFLEPGDAALVDPRDPAAIGRAVAGILADPGRAAAYRARSRLVAARHSLAARAERLEAVFRALAGGPAGGAGALP